ncbi:DUF4254 domain-containing protein [Nocardia gipuzkoensis]
MAFTPDDDARVLPSGESLLSAIRGHHVDAHRLARFAAEFGRLYQGSPAWLRCGCRCGSDELVLAVDSWAAMHLPVPRSGARLHTETLGAVIDRLARSQVRAYQLLMTVDDVADPQVHAAWYRLAELVDGYTDLADALTQRSVRLPALGDGC